MNLVFGIITMFAVGSSNAFELCSIRMKNAATMDFAETQGIFVQDVGLVRFEMGSWTKMAGNNLGNASLTLKQFTGRGHYPYILAHYMVNAKQIGTSSDCKVTQLNKVPSESIDSAILLAESFKLAIGDTYYVSESDSQWDVFYTRDSVDASMPITQIKQVLNTEVSAVEVYDHVSTLDFLNDIIEGDSEVYDGKDKRMYDKLKKTMLNEFENIHLIRVGEDDSGLIELYLVGRRADGRLVGLKAFSVET